MKKTGITRRGFITTALTGIASAGLAGLAPASLAKGRPASSEAEKKDKGSPIVRKLGRTGIEIPIVSMGVMNADNPEVLAASYDLGVRHFDTAVRYQNGNNERMVGKVIKELGVRDKVTVSTKIYSPMMRGSEATAEEKKKVLLKELDGSLKRLQMDHVDILYVHVVASAEEVKDKALLEAMMSIRESGKARNIGVSTHENMHEVVGAVAEQPGYDVVLTAVNFTMQDYTPLFKAIEAAAAKGVGVVAMKTQAGSQRGSKLKIGKEFPSSAVATAALKWVLRNPDISTAIPGYTTFEHMKEDFSVAYSLDYDEMEEKLLSSCDIKLGMSYCRQCRMCSATCSRGVDIPSLMRTHMYAARYSNFDQARQALSGIPDGRGLSACRSCRVCTARCVNKVDIASGIDELKMIYA